MLQIALLNEAEEGLEMLLVVDYELVDY